MIVRGRHLSRRALLRGIGGVAVALPFLDAMHPAMAAERNTAAAPVRRLGVVYYPHGVIYEQWTPDGDGGPLGALKPGLKPLERHTSKLTVVAGLTSSPDRTQPDFHDRAMASWLTGCELTRNKVQVGVSMDQIAAAKFGKETQFASLELATEHAYRVDAVYKDATTALPSERNPRVVFERLFGDGGKIDAQAAARRDAFDKSTLDAVTERITALKRRLGPADIRKLDQYLDFIRDIERRIQIAQSKESPELPDVTRPAGIPIDWVDHVKLMFDLQVLAYQADLTRVGTFFTAKEGSLMTFPQIGVNLQHHEASHHNYDPIKLDALHRVNVHQSELFAYYLDKLDAVKEANGSLLDNSVILFGSTLSNSTVHSQRDLPVMLAGGAAGRIKGGRFIRVPGDPPPWPFAAKWDVKTPTPMTNLHLTLLDLVGVPTEKLGDFDRKGQPLMVVRGRHLSRRALLRGLGGVAVALPFLDAMHPAMAAERNTAAAPVRRLGVVYYTHGVVYEKWCPPGDSGALTLTPALAPLAAHKDKLTVIAGLTSSPDRTLPDFHDRAMASWLTGCELTRKKVHVGVSMDQIAAAKFGKDTQFASLELATETPGAQGGPVYRDASTQLPFERNPRIVFERLFGDGGKIDPQASAQRDAFDKSTLDAVTERITALKRRLGPADIRKLDQYLESIRDIERRIQIAGAKQLPDLPDVTRPAGIPIEWVEHVKLMFDLQVLAYQADLTRVGTFMTAKEASVMTFPQIGVNMQHHEASHHNYDPAKLDALHRINVHQSELFAYYLSKLDAVKEASGSLLDNSVILFGSTLSNSTVHSQRDLPVMLAGGAAGRIKGGRFLRVPGDPPPWPFAAKWEPKTPTPMTNLHLTLLDAVGVPTEKLGDSTGRLSLQA